MVMASKHLRHGLKRSKFRAQRLGDALCVGPAVVNRGFLHREHVNGAEIGVAVNGVYNGAKAKPHLDVPCANPHQCSISASVGWPPPTQVPALRVSALELSLQSLK